MEQADVDGITLEYEGSGGGEPVVCIHGAFIADTFRPLLAEPSVAERYRLITYRRRGYVGCSRTPGPTSVACFFLRDAQQILGQITRCVQSAPFVYRQAPPQALARSAER